MGGTIKAAKAEMADKLQAALDELAAARELLAAIAEMATMPPHLTTGNWIDESNVVDALRLRAIHVQGAAAYAAECDFAAGSCRISAKVLLSHRAEPIPYQVYVPAEAAADA